MNENPQPFLSWCLIARNAAATIEVTLRSLRERTPDAEIVVVDTMSSDDTVEIARRFTDRVEQYRGPRGDWDEHMLAFDDAAAARNRSFELAHGRWLAWIDADDRLPGPEEAEKLLKENGRWHPGQVTELPGRPPTEPLSLEQALAAIETHRPDAACIWAPYLYRRNADGTAAEWQERERFVKNNGSHHWVGKGHEVLVAKNGEARGPLYTLSSLLFVHEKVWKETDFAHSVVRHYNALIPEYENGRRDARTCLYLENFSRIVCPQRRGEFLQAAYESSYTRLDRCRTLIRAGDYAAENGFFLDAIESYVAAMAIRPDLPDPLVAGAAAMERAEDWRRAAEWYEKAIELPLNVKESLVNPRDLLIGYPVRAAECWRRLGIAARRARNGELARAAADHRASLLGRATDSEAIGPDEPVVKAMLAHARNDQGACEAMDQITQLWHYLTRNEENEKAAYLLRCAPHTLEDHPTLRDLNAQAKKVRNHLKNPDAYEAFYNSREAGAEFPEGLFTPGAPLIPRTAFLCDWIEKELAVDPTKHLRILEVGCFDGVVGIQALRRFDRVHYVGLDAMKEALDRFADRAEKEKLADRLTLQQGLFLQGDLSTWRFDAIVFYEVIEHVPHPALSLLSLANRLRLGGRIFLSTPWGSCDRGSPPNPEKRDPRGHVRAMTARELFDMAALASLRVEEQGGSNALAGATLHLRARVADSIFPPVSFYVDSALWGWNATKVIETGMGASEETIVYLAKRLAENRLVNVYGPVPEEPPCLAEEVRDGVGYWTREKVGRVHDQRLLDRKPGTLVVSRAPSAGRCIDPEKKLDKVLWLQDSVYPDLNDETASDYRKIVTVSDWHRRLMGLAAPKEAHRIVSIPNFLLEEHFRKEGRPERERFHFVYASSPDRGLTRLLKLWPRVLDRWPDATLDIFYGWEGCMKLGAEDNPGWMRHYRKARTEFMALRWQRGVTDRGRVNHELLAREFQRAAVWAYPTSFAETGCLTAAKARAAGCVPVTTEYAGLAETAACPQTRFVAMPGVDRLEDPTGEPEAFESYAKAFLESVAAAIETSETERQRMSEEATEKYGLETMMKRWTEVLAESKP